MPKDRRELENKAREELREQGYTVDKAWLEASYIGPGRPITKRRDFFRAFDLIAVKNHHVRFIQVTSIDDTAKKVTRFDPTDVIGSHRRTIDENFPFVFISNGSISVELWCYRKTNGKWQRSIYKRKEEGWVTLEEPAQKTLAAFVKKGRKIAPVVAK